MSKDEVELSAAVVEGICYWLRQNMSAFARSKMNSVSQCALYAAGTIREHCESSVFNCLADMRPEVILEVSPEVKMSH